MGIQLSKGVELRSQIDTETVKALLLINGGGAVALLALLPSILDKKDYHPLAVAILVGILMLMIGLLCAVVYNRLRRKCSLRYETHGMRPPKGRLLGVSLPEPTVCCVSIAFMWASIAAFALAGTGVAVTGIITAVAVHGEPAAAAAMSPDRPAGVATGASADLSRHP